MIKLKYVSNVTRKDIGTFSPSENASYESVLSEILTRFANAGVSVDAETNHLYTIIEDIWKPLSESDLSHSGEIEIIYSDIVAPQNACFFHEADGIVYFFHTNEGNHLHQPHVHAKNSGRETSIYLKTFRADGDLGTKKQKIAVRFVKKHHAKFEEAWNKIIHEGICPRWKD